MSLSKKYFHWLFGENILRDDKPTYLINLEIGVSIRFDYDEAFFIDYEAFFNNVADVQFIYGSRPDDEEIQVILTDAWNFLCHVEREEENLMSELDNDDF